jgi:predicted Zn-dependent peptidase
MKHGNKTRICILLVILTASLQAAFASQVSGYLDNFEKRLTKFTLDNGMEFLVLERHEAPVVSFITFANVGAVNEVKGITGMAHIFEHVAFKGSPTIGSKDYKAESKALEKIENAFEALKAERSKGDKADKAKLDLFTKQFKDAQEKADKFIIHDDFEQTLSREGASGLNAFTSNDETAYVSSLPSNKLELWMYMESERFYEPVLREFYKERAVLSVEFKAHPYGEPVIGYMSDLDAISSTKAMAFYNKYYCPANLTAAIVGDVDPQQVKKLAVEYFGRIKARPKPEPVSTVEPPQKSEKRVVMREDAQPFLIIGYHTPSFNHPDSVTLETLSDILSSGRTSRLYKSMVKEKRIAVGVSAGTGLPGNKYPALFTFMANPSKGHTNQECEDEIYAQVEKLKTEPVTAEELQKAKTLAKASLIRQLNSNMGIAMQIANYEVLTGDWRNLFNRIDAIEKVTAEDIKRVSNEYLAAENRTVGCIETKNATK